MFSFFPRLCIVLVPYPYLSFFRSVNTALSSSSFISLLEDRRRRLDHHQRLHSYCESSSPRTVDSIHPQGSPTFQLITLFINLSRWRNNYEPPPPKADREAQLRRTQQFRAQQQTAAADGQGEQRQSTAQGQKRRPTRPLKSALMKGPSPMMLREQRMFERAQREEQQRLEQERPQQQEQPNQHRPHRTSAPWPSTASVDRRPRSQMHQPRDAPYISRRGSYDRSRDPRLRQESDPLVDELVRIMSGLGSTAEVRSSTNKSVASGGGTSGTSQEPKDGNRNPSGKPSQPGGLPASTPAPSAHGLKWVPTSTPSTFGAAAASVSSTYRVPPASSSGFSSGGPSVLNASSTTRDILAQLIDEALYGSDTATLPEPITYPSAALGGVPTPPTSPPKDVKGKGRALEDYPPLVPLPEIVPVDSDTTRTTASGFPYAFQPSTTPPTSHSLHTDSQHSQVASEPQISLPAIPTMPPIPAPPQPPISTLPQLTTQSTIFSGPTRSIKTIHLLHTASPYARHCPGYVPDAVSLNSNTSWDAFTQSLDLQDPINLDWNACCNAADPERNALALAQLDRAVERHYWTERWLKGCEMDGLDIDGSGVDDFVENGDLPPLTMLIPEEIKPIIYQRLCDLDDALTPPDILSARLDAAFDPRPVVARAYMISDEARDRYRYIYKGFRLLTAQLVGRRKMDQWFPTSLDWDGDLVI
ncbi:hypothetical protein D9619_005134 [Psilocybe cf. subviscida]|uniref:Uncharacterized protein n=1 Tax=Psilocybe cf. subviscida TaxID=2480587 RepID=A0A8H5F8C2_9AGAR|nr:hypothetical protein D9619_005134 [Psilocybe cf. subviscida]